MNKKAFTLVELIVTITILGILGTIAFISIQGYSKNSRDSVRLSDLSNIKTTFELFYIDSSKYPETTDGFNVNYSGSLVWTQGVFGSDTFSMIKRLDEIPIDPLTGLKYTYSITNNKQEYQLGTIMEGDKLSFIGLDSFVNAGNIEMKAYITGIYNGKIIKRKSGISVCEILSLPSIISNQSDTNTDLVDIINAKGLVYNGFKNLPTNYISSIYDSNGGFDFQPNRLVVYSDNDNCKALYGKDNTARNLLIENLQFSYSGTIISDYDGINDFVDIDLNDSKSMAFLGQGLVNNNLGGNIELDIPSDNLSSITGDGYSSCLSSGNTLNASTYYSGCDKPDIIVCTGAGQGYTVSACNVGSNFASTDHTVSSGDYFQFGKSILSMYGSSAPVFSGVVPLGVSYTPGNFSYSYDWKNSGGSDGGSANDWGVSDSDNTTITYLSSSSLDKSKMQGPCLDGYYIPTNKEWSDVVGSLGYSAVSDLYLPKAGNLLYNMYFSGNYGIQGYLWSSSPNGNNSYMVTFDNSNISSNFSYYRAQGNPVRCFKDIENTTNNSCEPSFSNASFIPGIPTSHNQSWQNADSLTPCYYQCINGYSGPDCSIAPSYSCDTQPYVNATYTEGLPTSYNQAWQNTNAINPCYYECNNLVNGNCDAYFTFNTSGTFGYDLSTYNSSGAGTLEYTGSWTNGGSFCSNLDILGFNDWYLPDLAELNILYNNKDTIGGFPSFSFYWSSLEIGGTDATIKSFDSPGSEISLGKTTSFVKTHCVRHD